MWQRKIARSLIISAKFARELVNRERVKGLGGGLCVTRSTGAKGGQIISRSRFSIEPDDRGWLV